VHKVWTDHTDCMVNVSHILKYMVCLLPVLSRVNF